MKETLASAFRLSVVYNAGTSAESLALKEASFVVEEGEFVVVFGPSGCGKSTLLYTMNGIERHITDGKLEVLRRDMRSVTPKEILEMHRNDIGMIFQAYNLLPTLTVLQNVALPLAAAGVSRRSREEHARELLKRFSIAGLADRFPMQLSGGQQQRAAIARALVHNPRLILADEPTGNLDSASAEIVIGVLLSLKKNDKKTILLVTHDPSYLPFADRVLYMKDGRIIKTEVKDAAGVTAPVGEGTSDIGVGSSPFDREIAYELSEDERQETRFIETFLEYQHLSPSPFALRAKNILFQFVLGRLSRRDAHTYLSLEVPSGGMGFSQFDSAKLLYDVFAIQKLRAGFSTKQALANMDTALSMRAVRWLVDGFPYRLSSIAIERIERLLSRSLNGMLGEDEVSAIASSTAKEGGLGMNSQVGKRFAQKMALLTE